MHRKRDMNMVWRRLSCCCTH